MSEEIPARIDPDSQSDRRSHFQGRISGHSWARLVDRERGPVLGLAMPPEGELRFHRDDHRRPVLEGHWKAALDCICQRCLGPLRLQLSATVQIVVVRSEAETERVPEPYDPIVLVPGEPLALWELIEDEILLALPPVPKHAELTQCEAAAREILVDSGQNPEPGDGARPNPFAILKKLQ